MRNSVWICRRQAGWGGLSPGGDAAIMTANPKVAHYPEIMHITPVSSGLRRLLAPALLLALPVLMTACGGGKARSLIHIPEPTKRTPPPLAPPPRPKNTKLLRFL
ncbi:hypothetical protein EKL94_17600 [Stenotrophomonas maltophilia]|uniref:Lipoprotein n=1 Tax=Stenotrophomonas maltophilia TaxID=40324 RepID=A0A3S0IU19_STEMA|nr:hypothetical protein EKL94_17600 [Stenotrophomonas maltophilia]